MKFKERSRKLVKEIKYFWKSEISEKLKKPNTFFKIPKDANNMFYFY